MRAARGGMPYSVPRKQRRSQLDEELPDDDWSQQQQEQEHSSAAGGAAASMAEDREAEDALAESALAESARQRAMLAQRLAAVPDSPARSDGVPPSPAGGAGVATPRRELPASQMTIQTSSGAMLFDSPARGGGDGGAASTPSRNTFAFDSGATTGAAPSPMDGRLTYAAAPYDFGAGAAAAAAEAAAPVAPPYDIAMRSPQDASELEALQAELHTASREHQLLQGEGYDDYHLVPNALRRQEQEDAPDRAAQAAHEEYEEAQRQRQAEEARGRELLAERKQQLGVMMQQTHLAKLKWLEADTEHQQQLEKAMDAAVAASGEKWEGRAQLEQLKQGAADTAALRQELEDAEESLDLKKKKYVQNRSFAKAMTAEIKKVEVFIQQKHAICLELEERLMMVHHEEMVLQAESGGL